MIVKQDMELNVTKILFEVSNATPAERQKLLGKLLETLSDNDKLHIARLFANGSTNCAVKRVKDLAWSTWLCSPPVDRFRFLQKLDCPLCQRRYRFLLSVKQQEQIEKKTRMDGLDEGATYFKDIRAEMELDLQLEDPVRMIRKLQEQLKAKDDKLAQLQLAYEELQKTRSPEDSIPAVVNRMRNDGRSWPEIGKHVLTTIEGNADPSDQDAHRRGEALRKKSGRSNS